MIHFFPKPAYYASRTARVLLLQCIMLYYVDRCRRENETRPSHNAWTAPSLVDLIIIVIMHLYRRRQFQDVFRPRPCARGARTSYTILLQGRSITTFI